MTKSLQRYDFGTLRDFRGPIQFMTDAPKALEEEVPPPPPPPTYDEDQLQQARMEAKKLGYQEGYLAGTQQANAEINTHQQHAETAMLHIAEAINGLAQTYNSVLDQQSANLSELALIIAKKVAAEALDARGGEAIAAMVNRCLPVIYSRPRILIEMHPQTMPVAESRLTELLRSKGFEGELQFRAAPHLGVTDVKLDWGTGMAERNSDALWADIESLLQRVPLTLEIPQSHAPEENEDGR